ncbi:MAG: Shikimate dehydrogenase (NADP(+)) [Burkholderia plantarii]|nr:MAG: Shikimate dehydrogenase (NADP(+)) [Burkholderia plantarii]
MDDTAIEGPRESDGAFAATVPAFIEAGGRGMNITAPFKLTAFEMADVRSARATLAGAANAFKFEDGRILAENFDGIGLLRGVQVSLHAPIEGPRVLLLGAARRVPGYDRHGQRAAPAPRAALPGHTT